MDASCKKIQAQQQTQFQTTLHQLQSSSEAQATLPEFLGNFTHCLILSQEYQENKCHADVMNFTILMEIVENAQNVWIGVINN